MWIRRMRNGFPGMRTESLRYKKKKRGCEKQPLLGMELLLNE